MSTIRISLALLWKDTRLLFGLMSILISLKLLSYWGLKFLPIHGFIRYAIVLCSDNWPGILAIALAISLNLEWFSGARQQILSAPTRRYPHILIKAIIVVVLGCLTSLIIGGISYPTSPHISMVTPLSPRERSGLPFPVLLSLSIARGWGSIVLSCGIVCFAQGVITLVKWYRFSVWLITCSAATYLQSFLFGILGNSMQKSSYLLQFYSWEAGIVLIIAGLLLFNRYAEA